MVRSGNALVLLSGGIDSAATLAFYLSRKSNVIAVFVDYGQPSRTLEANAADSLASHYAVELRTIKCEGFEASPKGYVRGRNSLLVHVGLTAAPFDHGLIAIGLIAGGVYPDCSKAWISESQRILDIYSDGRLQLVAPFIEENKAGVVDFCKTTAVPLGMTYSCETGQDTPCGACASCRDLEALCA